MKSETDAKLKALQLKAAKAEGDVKTVLNARANHLREEYQRSTAKVKSAAAGDLRRAANKIDA